MYLHVGEDIVLNCEDIVGIFDLDNTTVSPITRSYLAYKEKDGDVVNVSEKLPKSFIVCSEDGGEKVYISQISPGVLSKRKL